MYHPVLILNGPPHSGKDTIANELMARFNVRHLKFSAPLKRMVAGLMDLRSAGSIEQLKDRPFPFTNAAGESLLWRDVIISGSEVWLKELFGQDIFGKLMCQELEKPSAADFTVISDGGFIQELAPLLSAQVPYHSVQLCRVHRLGTSFGGDSRNYISPEFFPDRQRSRLFSTHFYNDIDKAKHPEVFSAMVDKMIDDWYNFMNAKVERKRR